MADKFASSRPGTIIWWLPPGTIALAMLLIACLTSRHIAAASSSLDDFVTFDDTKCDESGAYEIAKISDGKASKKAKDCFKLCAATRDCTVAQFSKGTCTLFEECKTIKSQAKWELAGRVGNVGKARKYFVTPKGVMCSECGGLKKAWKRSKCAEIQNKPARIECEDATQGWIACSRACLDLDGCRHFEFHSDNEECKLYKDAFELKATGNSDVTSGTKVDRT